MKRAILRLFCFFLCTLPQSSQSLTLKFGNLKPHPPPSRRDDAIPKLISHRLCFIASFLTSFHCLPKTCTTRQLLSVCKVYGPSIGRTLRPVFGPLLRGAPSSTLLVAVYLFPSASSSLAGKRALARFVSWVTNYPLLSLRSFLMQMTRSRSC
jgi:hypothetical protein